MYFGQEEAACLCSVCWNCHLWCYDIGRLGRVKVVTLRIGARAKEGKGEGRGEKKYFLFSLPTPSPAPFDSSHFLSLFEFQHGIFIGKTFTLPKKTPALQAIASADIKLLSHCLIFSVQYMYDLSNVYTWLSANKQSTLNVRRMCFYCIKADVFVDCEQSFFCSSIFEWVWYVLCLYSALWGGKVITSCCHASKISGWQQTKNFT